MIDFRSISSELRSTLEAVAFPEVALVEQRLETPPPIDDVAAAVRQALRDVEMPQGSVAIGIGSRGIARIDAIAAALVREIGARGGRPFVVPAMGSHGASNAEGQVRVLEHLGMTEATLGCPIRATMETVSIGRTAAGVEVFMDRHAFGADAVVVLNRVKLHTSFRGALESGPAKMLAIGLGKQDGARSVHAPGWEAMAGNLAAAAQVVLDTGKVAFGLAIIENAGEQPCHFVALPAARLLVEEAKLLEEVRALFPALPFDELDVLVVDRVGKNISGAGGDPNVTGRFPSRHISGRLKVARLVYLGFTAQGDGNGNGVGLADVVTADLVDAYRPSATYLNALTTTTAENARLPMVMPTRELAVAAALKLVPGLADSREARLVRILDTLHVARFWASRSALAELERAATDFEIVAPFRPFSPNDEAQLPSFA